MKTLVKFWNDEKGLETVEYAIIAGMIVVGIVATIAGIGTWVSNQFTQLKADLEANP